MSSAGDFPRGALPPEPEPFPPFPRIESARLYDSRWCGLRRDLIRLHDGSLQEHHVVEISDAIVVVPAFADGSLALIGQYRYPHGRTHWEVPAGRIAPGEAPRAAAERELAEEAGLASRRWIELPGFYPINGISPHWVHAFAALECAERGPTAHERSEQIVVCRLAEGDVRGLLAAGRFRDAFSALALFYYFQRSAG